MESTLLFSQVHPLLKAKSQLKRMKNRVGQQKAGETEAPGKNTATTARGGLFLAMFPASQTPGFVLCLGPRVLPWIIRLGPVWLLFVRSHDFIWPNLHAFLLIVGSIYVNLQSQT